MKNIIASFILFLTLLCGIFFSVKYINKTCLNFQNLNDQLEVFITKEHWDESYELSLNYLNQWKKSSKIITLYLNHHELDNINSETLKLTQYIKCKDKSEALSILHSMKFSIENIINSEKITLTNVF